MRSALRLLRISLGILFLIWIGYGYRQDLKVIFSQTLTNFSFSHAGIILGALLCYLAAIFLLMCRWYKLLKYQKIHLLPLEAVRICGTAFVITAFFPFAIGGDAFKIWRVASTHPKAPAILSVMTDRLIDYWSLLLWVGVFGPILWLPYKIGWILVWVSPLAIAFFVERKRRVLLWGIGYSIPAHLFLILTYYLCSRFFAFSGEKAIPSLHTHFWLVPLSLIFPGDPGTGEFIFSKLYEISGKEGGLGLSSFLLKRLLQWVIAFGVYIFLMDWLRYLPKSPFPKSFFQKGLVADR